ncbi:MAG: hypothetical protein IPN71_18550 [Fibrobacteres bacterium]|nr:hypothetical protein [Fibrobacterota bacterium]
MIASAILKLIVFAHVNADAKQYVDTAEKARFFAGQIWVNQIAIADSVIIAISDEKCLNYDSTRRGKKFYLAGSPEAEIYKSGVVVRTYCDSLQIIKGYYVKRPKTIRNKSELQWLQKLIKNEFEKPPPDYAYSGIGCQSLEGVLLVYTKANTLQFEYEGNNGLLYISDEAQKSLGSIRMRYGFWKKLTKRCGLARKASFGCSD